MNKLTLAALAMLSFGCAHHSNHAEEEERPAAPNPAKVAQLKALHPAAQTSGVVVVYRNTRFGSMFGPATFNGSLWIDDQAVGDVRDDTFNIVELSAGRHSFRVLGTATGLVVPLQATTVVTVAAGRVSYLALDTVQEFSNATVRFKAGGPEAIDAIATDCSEGFSLDLSPTQTSKL